MAVLNFLLLLFVELFWGALRSFHRAANRLRPGRKMRSLPEFEITASEWEAAAAELRKELSPSVGTVSTPMQVDTFLRPLADQLDEWIRENAGTGIVPWARLDEVIGASLGYYKAPLALLQLLREGRVAAVPDGVHPCERKEGPPCPPR